MSRNGCGSASGTAGSDFVSGNTTGACCVSTSTSVMPSDQTSLAVERPEVAASGALYGLGHVASFRGSERALRENLREVLFSELHHDVEKIRIFEAAAAEVQ